MTERKKKERGDGRKMEGEKKIELDVDYLEGKLSLNRNID